MITINHHHSPQINQTTIEQFYQPDKLLFVCETAMDTMLSKLNKLDKLANVSKPSAKPAGFDFPYFPHLTPKDWQKPLELDIYITDPAEGQQLNLDARGKDYATNILSYPSDLPAEVLSLLPSIPLGELVICHEVVERQAKEQGKTTNNHLHHLLVHGILHLLGFDHELGEDERIEMESFEIEILEKLGISNPYES